MIFYYANSVHISSASLMDLLSCENRAAFYIYRLIRYNVHQVLMSVAGL